MQRGAVAGPRRHLGERRGVVACVAAVEKRVAHDAHAQTPVGVGARDGVVHLRQDVPRDGEVFPDLEAHPAGSRVLTDGHAVGVADARVFHHRREHRLRPRFRLPFLGAFNRAQHVGPKLDRDRADRRVHGVGHSLGRKRRLRLRHLNVPSRLPSLRGSSRVFSSASVSARRPSCHIEGPSGARAACARPLSGALVLMGAGRAVSLAATGIIYRL